MINYKEINPNYIDVFLGKKKVGSIVRVAGGFQYRPKGAKVFGDVLNTIDFVKETLNN